MERLTGRNELGQAYFAGCYNNDCNGTGTDCDNCEFLDFEVCERLAAYEDIGLAPNEVKRIIREYQEMKKEGSERAEEVGGEEA